MAFLLSLPFHSYFTWPILASALLALDKVIAYCFNRCYNWHCCSHADMSHRPCCWGFAQNLVNYMLLLPFNYLNASVGAACWNYTRTNSSDGSYSIDDFCYCFCFHPIVDYVFCLGTLVNSYFSVLDFAGNYFGAGIDANVRDMEAVVANLGRLANEAGGNSAAGNNCLLRGCLGRAGGFLLACAGSADCIANSTAHGLSFN